MANFPMPVGNKTYFEGDIRKVNPDAFGFFYCKITTPDNLNHPILQTHVKTNNGLRTVSPLGTYYDLIFSHSIDNAMKLGYNFDILWGFTFDKKIIFKDFVDNLYKLRLDYPKSDPMNYIAKIILNSLYGRFGMRDDFDIIKILSSNEFNNITQESFSQRLLITEIIELDNQYLVQYKNNEDKYIPDDFNEKEFNINVAIASAITSYSRDYMSQFKNNPKLKLFYSDTDSIYTNLNPDQMNELYPGIVNIKGLGKLKLESVSKKVVFLSPKCYALQTINDEFIYKVKGLTKEVKLTITDFEKLLTKDSLIKKNLAFGHKWFKSLSQGSINVLKQTYTLQQSDNKRELMYNNKNILIDTKPYFINETKVL